MKAIVICKEIQSGSSKGAPDIGTGYSGFVHIGSLPGSNAIYVITGTNAQLTTIEAHSNTVGGLVITEGESVGKWPEMNQAIPETLRTKINVWLTSQGRATLPAGTTLLTVARLAAAHFDGLGNFDVFDGN